MGSNQVPMSSPLSSMEATSIERFRTLPTARSKKTGNNDMHGTIYAGRDLGSAVRKVKVGMMFKSATDPGTDTTDDRRGLESKRDSGYVCKLYCVGISKFPRSVRMR